MLQVKEHKVEADSDGEFELELPKGSKVVGQKFRHSGLAIFVLETDSKVAEKQHFMVLGVGAELKVGKASDVDFLGFIAGWQKGYLFKVNTLLAQNNAS